MENAEQNGYTGPPDFIPDGYNRTVGFDESPGVHRRFSMTYRPFAGGERGEQVDKAGAALDGEYKLLLGRMSGWSYDQPLSVESLRAQNSAAYDKMKMAVLGFLAPDFEIDGDGREVRKPLPDTKQEQADAKN